MMGFLIFLIKKKALIMKYININVGRSVDNMVDSRWEGC